MNVGSRMYLTNTTLSGNTAGQAGGGLYTQTGGSLRHVTLAENRAVIGGAILVDFSAIPVLTNTIVANSPQGGNCFGPALPAKYSLDSDSTCSLTGAGNIIADPRLTALGDYGGPTNVHMLLVDSPALNGVNGSDAALVDQRGLPRPVGPHDIGAVERQAGDSSLAPRIWLPLVLR
jgi:predicted outer membrane repeat protein